MVGWDPGAAPTTRQRDGDNLKYPYAALTCGETTALLLKQGNETSAAAEGTCLDDRGPMLLHSFESIQPSPRPANEGAARSDNQELVLYEKLPTLLLSINIKFQICEADEMSMVPCDSYIVSPFDLKLMAVLSEPYDQQEHEMLWKHANFRKPALQHKDLRNQSKWLSTRQIGFSYLDHFPDLAKKSEHSDPQQALNLLHGLFFWLKIYNVAFVGMSKSREMDSHGQWNFGNPMALGDDRQRGIIKNIFDRRKKVTVGGSSSRPVRTESTSSSQPATQSQPSLPLPTPGASSPQTFYSPDPRLPSPDVTQSTPFYPYFPTLPPHSGPLPYPYPYPYAPYVPPPHQTTTAPPQPATGGPSTPAAPE
ncbi:hypothetical protein IEQ34_008314 [Dendrobium chrysotoxum]|uniref:Uncharacterized protein n=1 Tax=Dendrobium chrysotoxum TaxID=161865 RepID=A0AAV7GG45_DENCH|nr:hypothetical protein IEQ34_008314 [Dendrobium chrysotoxum]